MKGKDGIGGIWTQNVSANEIPTSISVVVLTIKPTSRLVLQQHFIDIKFDFITTKIHRLQVNLSKQSHRNVENLIWLVCYVHGKTTKVVRRTTEFIGPLVRPIKAKFKKKT